MPTVAVPARWMRTKRHGRENSANQETNTLGKKEIAGRLREYGVPRTHPE